MVIELLISVVGSLGDTPSVTSAPRIQCFTSDRSARFKDYDDRNGPAILESSRGEGIILSFANTPVQPPDLKELEAYRSIATTK